MGSQTINGLYLKDQPYMNIEGTWTGYVDVAGQKRLIVAFEVVRDEQDIYLLKPKEEGRDQARLMELLLDLNSYTQMTPTVNAEGELYIFFMPAL